LQVDPAPGLADQVFQCNSSTSVYILIVLEVLSSRFHSRGTLGASSVLGIIQDNHLTTDQFNTLGSAFYIGAPCLWLHFMLTDKRR
jgi:hypothetical protein